MSLELFSLSVLVGFVVNETLLSVILVAVVPSSDVEVLLCSCLDKARQGQCLQQNKRKE